MSGFAGFCTFPDPSPDASNLLARLQRALPPSDPAPLLFAGGCAGLAAARLARSADGRLAAAFDGAIYNRDALRAGLTTPLPATAPDAELVLALYARHGAACVEQLRGPFALAVWDVSAGGRDGACLLARDPLGLRSLYYYHDEPGGRLFFATGVRPLAASGVAPRQLDARGLYGFFRYGAVPEPFSIVAGVSALEPGGRRRWADGRLSRETGCVPAPELPAAVDDDPASAAKSLRAALLDSVTHHLADDRPAGIFVGGGAGSAALLALAREAGREKNLRALTVSFDGAAPDESVLARRAAEHFGVPHTLLRLDRDRVRAWFDDFLPALDQPGVHGFPWFALCRAAREEGVGTALAGVGAGELFGDVRLQWRLAALLRAGGRHGRTRAAVGRALLAVASRPSWQRLADFLTRPPTPAGAYAALRGIHTAGEARALVARFTDPTGCADPVPGDVAANESPTLDDGINALERQRRLRDQLLRDLDAASRAHRVELRLPFVDARVAEALARIPAAVRLRGEHWCLLRAAVPEIPGWVDAETARGPQFPFDAWRAGEWGAAKPTDAAGSRTRRAWQQKWGLFLFRRWWRQVEPGAASAPPR